MRKLLLSVVALAGMAFSSSAVTYMCVHTSDGKTIKYDVENVTYVDYEDVPASTDTAKSDTTGTYAQVVTVSGQVGNYTYVDLGLPSGTKWATYNVGATTPTEYGDYFAWGETTPKEDYSWETYKWCNGSYDTQTKYCVDSDYGTVDSLTTLLAEDDAATQNWGRGWRMPTRAEQNELQDGCEWEWTADFNGSGVSGRIGTSKTNGNTIFLPAAGDRYGTDFYAGNYGYYWLSSLLDDDSSRACHLLFTFDSIAWYYSGYRNYGRSVRAVVREIDGTTTDTTKIDSLITDTTKIDSLITDTTKIDTIKSDTTRTYAKDVTVSGQVGNYTYVDLGLESGTKWATYNVGATQPTEYGDYFAWGETTPKENYSWTTYKWCNGSETTLTKYCVNSQYGTFDSLTTLLAEDDAATVNWGTDWRIPTRAEQNELQDGCEWEWTADFNGSGVAGRIGTSKTNGNIIFLPAAGDRYGTDLYYAGSYGYYWLSSLLDDDSSRACHLFFTFDCIAWNYSGYRNYGRSVRAVVREK